MTDNDIAKAVEYWEEFDKEIDSLLPAPPDVEEMLDEQKKIVKITLEAFDLINRQKAEIERLKEKNESLDTLVLSYGDYVTKARAEAVKEFAEIVKANKNKLFNYIYSSRGFDEQIDNLLKEMGVEG